jgi:Ca2+-transporting ATPase
LFSFVQKNTIQTIVIFVGGAASISGGEWGISMARGFASIPLGVLIPSISNEPCQKLVAETAGYGFHED